VAQAALANGSLVLEGTRAEAGRYQCEATIPGIGTILSRIARVSFQGNYYTVCTYRYLERKSTVRTTYLGT